MSSLQNRIAKLEKLAGVDVEPPIFIIHLVPMGQKDAPIQTIQGAGRDPVSYNRKQDESKDDFIARVLGIEGKDRILLAF